MLKSFILEIEGDILKIFVTGIESSYHRVSNFLRDTIPIYHRITIPFQSHVIGFCGFGSRVVRG